VAAYTSGYQPVCVLPLDTNDDGKLDIVTANSSGSVSVLRGFGNGAFPLPVRESDGDLPRGIAAADFNGDGHEDLVTMNTYSDNVAILIGYGNGKFTAPVPYPVGERPTDLALADVNDDGVIDIVAATSGSDDISILFGVGDGTFGSLTRYRDISVGRVKVADINNDGYVDIVAKDAGAVYVFLGLGDGAFDDWYRFEVEYGDGPIALSDLNGDGNVDIAMVRMSSDDVAVSLGAGDGTFAEQVNYTVGDDPRSITLADYNGDGHTDIATANLWGESVSVLLAFGDGTFGTHQTYPAGPGPLSSVADDINNDGVVDLVIANNGARSTSVLLGIGDGTFAPYVRFATGSNPFALVLTVLRTNLGGPASGAKPDGPESGPVAGHYRDLVTVNDESDTSIMVLLNQRSMDEGLVIAEDDTYEVAEDAEASRIDVLLNDVGEGVDITSASQGSRGGKVAIADNQLQYTPAAGFVGREALTYTIANGTTESTGTVIVTVGTPAEPYIDFSDYEIQSFSGTTEDVEGTVHVEAAGSVLHLVGNLLKAIDLSYSVTPNTRLEFDFRSAVEGEIHAIGTDLSLDPAGVFKLYGTESGDFTELDDYAPAAPDFKHYEVPLADVMAGDMTKLWFMNNQDIVDPSSESSFANVRLLEADSGPAVAHDDIIGRVAASGDWWLARSDGTSFTNEKIGSWSSGITWEHVLFGDFNGDDQEDIVGRDANTGRWYVSTSTDEGLTTKSWGIWSTNVAWQDVTVGDFNGDGLDDLIGRVSSSGDWWVAQSTGTAFANAKWGRWSTAVSWLDVKIADFDGDGRLGHCGPR
jgi:hypothetical protein